MDNKSNHAFTFVELLLVITVLALLAAIAFPALAQTKPGVQRVYCSNNLKQVGIAFRTWAASRNGVMPMAYPSNQGGASTAVGVAANSYGPHVYSINYPSTGPKGVFGMFFTMSNELATPKILFCPSESSGLIMQASIFGNDQTIVTNGKSTYYVGFNSDTYVSYFVGVDANENTPNMLLAGDHNLGTGSSQATHVPQFVSAGTNANWASATAIGWQDNQHRQKGNAVFPDGSVQTLTTPQFRVMLNNTGDKGRAAGTFVLAPWSMGGGVNRLQMPRIL